MVTGFDHHAWAYAQMMIILREKSQILWMNLLSKWWESRESVSFKGHENI